MTIARNLVAGAAFVIVVSLVQLSARQGPAGADEPSRVSEAAVRAVAVEASNTLGDVKGFQREFASGLSRLCPGCNYQIVPLVPASLRTAITAGAYGPVSGFYMSATDVIRARKPIAQAVWVDGVTVLVVPSSTSAPNIQKVLVFRNGTSIPALSSTLQLTELGTGVDVTGTSNGGRVTFPLSAFDQGASVRIVLVPASGTDLVTTLSKSDLAMLR